MEKEKKPKVTRKLKNKSKTKKVAQIKYVHIDQFINSQSLDPSIAIGFRAYMRGRTYLHSYEDFEKAYHEYLHRKI